jgi:hypothetical protein
MNKTRTERAERPLVPATAARTAWDTSGLVRATAGCARTLVGARREIEVEEIGTGRWLAPGFLRASASARTGGTGGSWNANRYSFHREMKITVRGRLAAGIIASIEKALQL